jgi:hypothetical protein
MPVTRLTFTGTRRGLTLDQENQLVAALNTLAPQIGLHGCCEGSDRVFHRLLGLAEHSYRELYPSNEEQRQWALAHLSSYDILYPVEPPLDRDNTMALRADVVVACPSGRLEIRRSGTWATVRRARLYGKPILFLYPDGSTRWERR